MDTLQSRKRKRRWFRFSLKFLLIFTALFALPFAYYVKNVNHWQGISQLRKLGVTVVFRRENPSWLDSKLGDFRFDEVKTLENPLRKKLAAERVSEATSNLRKLDEFSIEKLGAYNFDSYEFLKSLAPKIQSLDVGENFDLSDTFVSNFRTLRSFTIRKQGIIDFSGIANLGDIESIACYNGIPKNLDCIRHLKYLTISSNSSIAPLPFEHLKSLRGLRLEFVQLHNLNQLQDLQQLDYLYLDAVEINDFSSASKVKSLRFLDVSDSKLNKFERLADCPELVAANFERTMISDIAVFSGLRNLTHLSFDTYSEKPITLGVLGHLPALTHLSIGNSNVMEFDFDGFEILEELELRDSKFEKSALNELRESRPELVITFVSGIARVDENGNPWALRRD